MMSKLIKKYNSTNLVLRILIGLIFGVVFGFLVNLALSSENNILHANTSVFILKLFNVLFEIFGNLFIGSLRAIAPILVFFLISSSIMNSEKAKNRTVQNTMILYIFATFLAALVTVTINYCFQINLILPSDVDTSSYTHIQGMREVVINIFKSIVANPVDAIANTNFLGVLFWAIMIGICAHGIANDSIKKAFKDVSDVITKIVKIIISFAPFGIGGLIYTSIVDNGFGIFADYGMLICVYVVCVFVMAFVVNALIIFLILRKNPYPLIFRAVKEVAVTAFFMRSSAANIPLNMQFCEKLHLDKRAYSITIPLGATINMEGCSITIITLTLACCNTLGINVDFGQAFILSIIAAISAVGASGVSGGSILLVPMACSLFGISGDIASSVVAVGFIIGVIQDSLETALNSSTDGLFTATMLFKEQIKKREPYHKIIGGKLDDYLP